MPNYLTSVLAAHLDIAQVRIFRATARMTESLDAVIVQAWRRILAHTRKPGTPRSLIQPQAILEELYQEIAKHLYWGLRDVHAFAARQAQQVLLEQIPVQVLSLAAEAAAGRKPRGIKESRRATPAERRRIERELFSTVDEQRADSIIYRTVNGSTWQTRLASATRLADPQDVARVVRDWAASEQSPRQLETALAPILQNVRVSVRRVARTEAQFVATQSRLDEYERMGNWVIGYQIHGTMDARIRPHHAARNGNIYYRNPKPGQLSMDRMPRPPIDEDGSYAHNCFPGETLVEGNFDGALKTRYTGQIVKIKTRSGFSLTCTPNHPICTDAGFRPAGKITKGDNLVCHKPKIEGSFSGANNKEDKPATIEDLFCSAQKVWPTAVESLTAFDLHGDAKFTDSKVEIASINRHLVSRRNALIHQGGNQFFFKPASPATVIHPSDGSFHFDGDTVNLPSSGIMSGSDLGEPGNGIHPGPFQFFSIGTASKLNASRLEPCGNRFTADTEFIGQLFHGNPESVFLDDVISVEVDSFCGHVFDLQSPNGFIVANGIIVSNCRCWLTPVVDVQPQIENDPAAKKLFRDAEKKLVPDPSVYNDWFRQATEDERAEAVGGHRLRVMRNKLQADPTWAHFLDPETGRILPLGHLRRETPAAMARRLERANDLLSKRKALAEKVYQYGYLPPEFEPATRLAVQAQPLPARYAADHWKKVHKAEKIKPVAARRAIAAKIEDPVYRSAFAYAVANRTLAGWVGETGIGFARPEADRVMADAQFALAQARGLARGLRTTLALPPGTLGVIRADINRPVVLRNMTQIGLDVFDPLARGMEQIQAIIAPGVPTVKIGRHRYLPPGTYTIDWATDDTIQIGGKR